MQHLSLSLAQRVPGRIPHAAPSGRYLSVSYPSTAAPPPSSWRATFVFAPSADDNITMIYTMMMIGIAAHSVITQVVHSIRSPCDMRFTGLVLCHQGGDYAFCMCLLFIVCIYSIYWQVILLWQGKDAGCVLIYRGVYIIVKNYIHERRGERDINVTAAKWRYRRDVCTPFRSFSLPRLRSRQLRFVSPTRPIFVPCYARIATPPLFRAAVAAYII